MTHQPPLLEVQLRRLAASRVALDPAAYPEVEFDLLSIPAYDVGKPERIVGALIGSTKLVVQPDDVMISKIVPHIQRVWIVPPATSHLQIASSEWIVLRATSFDPRYIRYSLLSESFHAKFMATVEGMSGSLQRARPKDALSISILRPALNVQNAIADYLDHETAQIDTLIAKQEQLITTLRERRQAMVDRLLVDVDQSGWTRLKYLATVQTGVALSGEGAPDLPAWPYLRVANVQIGRIDLDHVTTIRLAPVEAEKYLLRAGDVLMTEGGDEVGCVKFRRRFLCGSQAAVAV